MKVAPLLSCAKSKQLYMQLSNPDSKDNQSRRKTLP